MAILRTENLATGSEVIDNQHKELFSRINGLLEACKQGKGKSEVERVIRFLEDYVVEHFAEEERYMTSLSYPGYGEHKAQHLEFMDNFFTLKKQFEEEGAGLHIVVKTNHIVVDWLKNHIRRMDKSLGVFVKANL
jgi:hemerythrin